MKRISLWKRSKRFSKKTFIVLLAISVLLTTIGYINLDSLNPFKELAEAKELRNEYEKVYELGDGKYRSKSYATPIHYKSADGEYRKINTKLEKESKLVNKLDDSISAENYGDLENISNGEEELGYRSVGVNFGNRLPEMFNKGYSISYGKDSLKYIPVGANESKGKIINDSEIKYENAWRQTDVHLKITSEGIKEDIILKNKTAPTEFKFEVEGKLGKDLTSGKLELLPAWLEDAKGTTRDVALTVAKEKDKTYVKVTVDVKKLSYPILIDPTTVARTIDAEFTYQEKSTTYCQNKDLSFDRDSHTHTGGYFTGGMVSISETSLNQTECGGTYYDRNLTVNYLYMKHNIPEDRTVLQAFFKINQEMQEVGVSYGRKSAINPKSYQSKSSYEEINNIQERTKGHKLDTDRMKLENNYYTLMPITRSSTNNWGTINGSYIEYDWGTGGGGTATTAASNNYENDFIIEDRRDLICKEDRSIFYSGPATTRTSGDITTSLASSSYNDPSVCGGKPYYNISYSYVKLNAPATQQINQARWKVDLYMMSAGISYGRKPPMINDGDEFTRKYKEINPYGIREPGDTFTLDVAKMKANDNWFTVMPEYTSSMNNWSTLLRSSTLTYDWTFVAPNTAPSTPGAFTSPSGTVVDGDKTSSITWGSSYDPQGDYLYYETQVSNNGTWSNIYSGTAITTNYVIPKSSASVQFRVRATDSKGLSSGWRTSNTYNVNNNTAPNPPGNFTSPTKDLISGEKTDINWGISTDPDGVNKYNYSEYQINKTPSRVANWYPTEITESFSSCYYHGTVRTDYEVTRANDGTPRFSLTGSPIADSYCSSPHIEENRQADIAFNTGKTFYYLLYGGKSLMKVTISEATDIYQINKYLATYQQAWTSESMATVTHPSESIGGLLRNFVANDGAYPTNGGLGDKWYTRDSLSSGVTIKYYLDVQYNAGTWSSVASGTAVNQLLKWAIPTDITRKTVRFRVRASDQNNEYSGYTYSDTLNIIHDKQPPVIGSIQGHQNTNTKDSIPVSIYNVTDQTGVDRVEVFSKKTNEPSFILHGMATKVGTSDYRYDIPNRGEGLYTVQFVPVDTLGNVTYGFQPNYETTFRVDYTLPTFTEMRLTGSNYQDGLNHWIKANQPFKVNLRGTDVSGFSKLKNSLVGVETNTDTAFANYDNLLNTSTKGGTRANLTIGDTARVINQDETTETETDYSSKESITNIQRYKLQYSLTDKATNTTGDTDSGISLNIDGEEPSIKNGTTVVQIVNKPKFIVEVDGINDGEGSGIKDVVMPTWSSKDDQDDLKKPWLTNKEYLSTKTGDEKYQLDVDIKDHNNDEGKYETNIYPVDNVGNKANVKTVITYVDLTKPVVTDNNPTNWVKGPFNLKLTLADSLTGVKAFSCDCGKTINFEKSGDVYPTLKEVDYEVSENKDYTFTITDGAGNETTHTVKVQFLDNDGPVIEADPDKKAPTTKAVKVNVTVTDGKSGTEAGLSSKDYVLNEFDEAPKTASTAWQPLGAEYTLDKAGTWYLHVKAIDRVGNQTIKTFGPYTIRFDAQSPDIFVEIEKGREFLEFGKKEFDVEFKAIDDIDEASKLKFEYSTDMVNWSDPTSFTEDGVVSRTLDVPNGLSRGDAITVFARVKDTVGNYTIIDDKIIYGKDTYIEDGNTIGETVEFAGYSWIYVGGYKLVTKTPASGNQTFSTGTNDFSTTATGNIGRYLNTTFLKSLEDNLEPKDFEHIELFSWQNGNSRVSGKVGLMTEEEYRNVNHIFKVATNAMTITKGSSANNIMIARPDGKTSNGSTTTPYAVHPAIKLKAGTMIVEGKIKYTKDTNSVMEKINQIENKMIGVKSVQSLNRLTSRVDNQIELAITKEPGISIEISAGNIQRSQMTFTGNKVLINIKNIPSAYIPEFIEVYGYTDRDGNGKNEAYEFVSSKKIFRKDFFFESSDVD